MNYRNRTLYCYNCNEILPRAAMRCPWCSSGRVSHVPRHPVNPGDLHLPTPGPEWRYPW